MGNNLVYCKDCKYLMFSDCYGECSKAYRGIVNPDDYCEYGEKRQTGGFKMNKELPITIIIGNGEDAYEEVYKVVEKYIKKDDLISLDDYYVTFELISNGKPDMHTQLLRYDFDIGDYVWENDWWEGENTIIVYGLADVSTLLFNGYHEHEVIK